MPHLIFSCLESRTEDNGALFGRYLLGPLRIGQATTVATALRRALLSEVQGIGITAVEIVGASHQYSSIKGVRESVLDIILNLKQIVLRGTTVHDLPAIGYVDIQGPGVVTANDLILPNGICCVNSNQLIATLSANGLLKIKFVVSVGKSRLTPYTDSAHFLSETVFKPKTRLGESRKVPLHRRKRLRQTGDTLLEQQGYEPQNSFTSFTGSKEVSFTEGKEVSFTLREKRAWLISKLHTIIWGRENNIILYNKKRRSNVSSVDLVQSVENYPYQEPSSLAEGVTSRTRDSETSESETFSKEGILSANKKELSSLNASTSALKRGLSISSSSLKNRFFKGVQGSEALKGASYRLKVQQPGVTIKPPRWPGVANEPPTFINVIDDEPLIPTTSQMPEVAKYLKQKEINLFSLKEKHISIEAAKRFNKRLYDLQVDASIKETGRPIFLGKPVGKFPPNLLREGMGIGVFNEMSSSISLMRPSSLAEGRKDEANSLEGDSLTREAQKASRAEKEGQMLQRPKPLLSRSVLPIDPNFTPITRVNFAIQMDEQWQEPRERIILEVWSNGSIHPRQAIHEAATNLVYVFSLLR